MLLAFNIVEYSVSMGIMFVITVLLVISIYSALFVLGCYIVCEADADVSLHERRDASWTSSASSSVQHPVPALLSLLVLTHALDYKR